MNTISIETPPARPAEVPRGQILLEPAPELPDSGGDGMTQALVYLPMAAMAIGTAAMLAGSHVGAVGYVGAGAIGVGMAGMMASQLARRHSDRPPVAEPSARRTPESAGQQREAEAS